MLKTEDKKKEKSWQTYLDEPHPDRISHLWKYSDPEWFEPNKGDISFKSNLKLNFKLDNQDEKIVLINLNEALENKVYNNLIPKYFGELIKKNLNKITCLNEATWSNGYFLYVPKGIKSNVPILVKFTSEDKASKYEAFRALIILEDEAEISLIDEGSLSSTNNSIANSVIEIFLNKGAKLNYLNLQTNSNQVTQHLFQRAQIESHSEFTNLIVALGGNISKTDLGANLNGHGAGITTYGIVLGDGTQKFDHHTTIDHIAPHTRSELNFRVALKEKAHSAYTGNLKIRHEAVKSDAHQENRNLLLSKEARAESIPELEILTNDVVRCNHGVTVGQVDKDQIYYLMSRGVNEKDAEKVIIEGFLEPTISRIPEEKLKEEIREKVKSKLDNL